MEIKRESIFVSALRSFCRMFFAVCGIFLAFILMSLFYNAVSDSTSTTETKTKIKYLADAHGNKATSTTCPVVLQIKMHGIVGDPKHLDAEMMQNVLYDSRNG